VPIQRPRAEAAPRTPVPAGSPPVTAAATPAKAKTAKATRAARGPRGPYAWADVAIAAALALMAALAAGNLPVGALRYLLTVPMLVLVPGYLLLQAFVVPPARGAARGWQVLASLGLSPAVVGLLALTTAIVQGGFRLPIILILVTLASLGLGAVALARRRALAPLRTASPTGSAGTASVAGAPSGASPAGAATAKSGPLRP
jgi:hypothetical protein